jgi:hypothetical protein
VKGNLLSSNLHLSTILTTERVHSINKYLAPTLDELAKHFFSHIVLSKLEKAFGSISFAQAEQNFRQLGSDNTLKRTYLSFKELAERFIRRLNEYKDTRHKVYSNKKARSPVTSCPIAWGPLKRSHMLQSDYLFAT